MNASQKAARRRQAGWTGKEPVPDPDSYLEPGMVWCPWCWEVCEGGYVLGVECVSAAFGLDPEDGPVWFCNLAQKKLPCPDLSGRVGRKPYPSRSDEVDPS